MQEEQIEDLLQTHGLICHTFAFDTLPNDIQNRINTACNLEFNHSYLSLLANVGGQFWTAMQSAHALNAEQLENPVDAFSIALSRQLLKIAELCEDSDILYPGDFAMPLISLGEQARWSTPSPLGLGLHPEYGPWFAYRALIKTKQPIRKTPDINVPAVNTSACASCVSKPCVTACPADAVDPTASFNIKQCAAYRIQSNTSCARQCHARNACPVGSQYKYSEEQLAYHMTHALDALVRWSFKIK